MDAPQRITSPTGDPRMDKLVPLVDRAIAAAHTHDQLGIDTAIADATAIYGDELTALRALFVLAAGACPDDEPVEALLTWRVNTTEYRRLRALHVPAAQARELAARVTGQLAGKATA